MATAEIPDTTNILPKPAHKRLIFFRNWPNPEFLSMMNIRELCVYFTPGDPSQDGRGEEHQGVNVRQNANVNEDVNLNKQDVSVNEDESLKSRQDLKVRPDRASPDFFNQWFDFG